MTNLITFDEFLNEKEYKDGALRFRMEKPGSPHYIEFQESTDIDDCFSIKYKNKKGEVKRAHTILDNGKDEPQWQAKLEREGWKITEDHRKSAVK